MHTKISYIILLLSGMLYAQLNAPLNIQSNAPTSVQKGNTANVSSDQKGILTLDTINADQKRHFNVYYQINKLKEDKTFSYELSYEPIYSPFIRFTQQLLPIAEKAAKDERFKAAQLTNRGNTYGAQVSQRLGELYDVFVKICQNAAKEYQAKHPNNLNYLMEEYKKTEYYIIVSHGKVPKRDWITPLEAEVLIREYIKRLNND